MLYGIIGFALLVAGLLSDDSTMLVAVGLFTIASFL